MTSRACQELSNNLLALHFHHQEARPLNNTHRREVNPSLGALKPPSKVIRRHTSPTTTLTITLKINTMARLIALVMGYHNPSSNIRPCFNLDLRDLDQRPIQPASNLAATALVSACNHRITLTAKACINPAGTKITNSTIHHTSSNSIISTRIV